MNETSSKGKKGLVLGSILVILVAVGLLIFFQFNKKPGAEQAAVGFLTQMFTCTQQDYKEFEETLGAEEMPNSSLVGISSGGDEAIRAYFEGKYPGMMTEQGMEKALAQRVLAQGLVLADQNKMDLVAQKVELKNRSANADTVQFDFTVTAADAANQENQVIVTGTIGMIEQEGQFKVDLLTLN